MAEPGVASITGTDSGDFLIVASGLVSVLVVYSLILFVKNRYSSKKQTADKQQSGGKEEGEEEANILCHNCQESSLNCRILYNKLYATKRKGKCSKCGNDLVPAGANGHAINGSHQHPIIFGKSKDSILVPDFNRNQSVDSASSSTSLSVQTRVLTDENGHSIKIRVASPPPQRQTQLAAVKQQPTAAAEHRDSIISLGGCSESPLIGCDRRDSLIKFSSSDDQHNQVQLEDKQQFKSPRLKRKPRNHLNQQRQQRQQQLASQRPKSSMARLAGEYPPSFGQGGDSNSNSNIRTAGGDVGQEEERSSTPIEAFNDSNTSEFDDDACDSRQDTSFDGFTLARSNAVDDVDHDDDDQQPHSGNSNESVMDADVRRTNRLNMELRVLQSAAQNVISGAGAPSRTGPGQGSTANLYRSFRSKSVTGSNAAFPQSGTLPLASDYAGLNYHGLEDAALRRQLSGGSANGRRSRETSGSMNDQDSGCVPYGDDLSRKSSLAQPFSGPWPSLRVSIEPLEARSAAPGGDHGQPGEMGGAGAGGHVSSILHSLASIGRSASRQSQTDQQEQQQQQQQYEVCLQELRNIRNNNNNNSCQSSSTDQQMSPRSSPAGRRRESLFGALVAAATNAPGSAGGRRSSVDGIFARVFKNQQETCASAKPIRPTWANSSASTHEPATGNNQHYDTLSLHSACSIQSGSQQSTSEFIQLPLVKIQSCSAESTLDFSSLGDYRFVCLQSEFPLRISLYQVGKRGGARFTLGHCFVAPAELAEGEGRRFLTLSKEEKSVQMEYRLYSTILEAIKQ